MLGCGLSEDCNDDGIPDECQPPGWQESAKLLPDDRADLDLMGSSIALSGNVAVAGAYRDDDNGLDSGSAYVFRIDGENWSQEQKLLPEVGAENDRFGNSVAVSEGVIVVGALFDDELGDNSGSAYVFRFNGTDWVQETKLLPNDG